jgi:hypothetical protein
MYQICLVIKEDLREEQASMVISGHETLDEASKAILNIFTTVNMIYSLEPGQSYTIFSGESENTYEAPPNLMGADGESRPVF